MMTISTRQQEKSRRKYAEFRGEVDEGRIKRILHRLARKIERVGTNPPESLAGVWADVKLMAAMLRDYTRGDYKAVPWKVVASVAGAVIYFVTPFDAVFDYIPISGFIDDALVIKLALDFANDDLRRYAKWKESRAGGRSESAAPETVFERPGRDERSL